MGKQDKKGLFQIKLENKGGLVLKGWLSSWKIMERGFRFLGLIREKQVGNYEKNFHSKQGRQAKKE